jgi:hypothetical protein
MIMVERRNHKMNKISNMLFIVSLCGCVAAYSTPIVSPTGEHWIGVDCKGQSQNACWAEAGYQCPNGYSIQDNEGHFSTEFNLNANSFTGVNASQREIHTGSMIIKCQGKSRAELEDEKNQVQSVYNNCYFNQNHPGCKTLLYNGSFTHP